MTPAEQLAQAIDARKLAETLMANAVIRCRQDGWSWADLAEPLGVTRAAVFQRYRHLGQLELNSEA